MKENPLSPELIEELNSIAQLPPDKQKEKLSSFVKKLTPEQLEFLKKQQGVQCPFCSIAEGKLESKKIYEDDAIFAVLDIRPATKGHVLIFPKHHYSTLQQMNQDQSTWLFTVATKLLAVIHDVLKPEGSNLILSTGAIAGQTIDHILIHIIPRNQNDGVTLFWKGAEITPDEFTTIQKQLVTSITEHPLQPKPKPQKEYSAQPEENNPYEPEEYLP